MIVKYTFILCAFGAVGVYVFFFIVNQTSNSLILTKNYMHPIFGGGNTFFNQSTSKV
jgi:hypothetical protein